MKKQFANKEDFDRYILNLEKGDMKSMLNGGVSEKDIAKALLNDGYTDLDDLVADGHAYQIDGHTNNGWIYEDEAEIDYIKRTGRDVEIRRR